MTTCCGVLGQRIPRAEEPGRLQSMGLKQSDTTEVTSVLILIDKPYLLVVDLRSVSGYRILSLSLLLLSSLLIISFQRKVDCHMNMFEVGFQ